MVTWEHPNLGAFTFDDYGWVAEVDLPAFAGFTYRWHGRQAGQTKHKIEFAAERPDDFPSRAATTIAERIMKNQESLVSRIKNAVWKDLHGKGEDSGMWWHGDLDTVRQQIGRDGNRKTLLAFAKSDDVLGLIGSASVVIRESIYLYERPIATIKFEAAFDVEHGLGVLTDGNRVLGIGYQMDPSPFFKEQVTGSRKRS